LAVSKHRSISSPISHHGLIAISDLARFSWAPAFHRLVLFDHGLRPQLCANVRRKERQADCAQ
jgi:hypothetical protein